jgi:hypothetical protein
VIEDGYKGQEEIKILSDYIQEKVYPVMKEEYPLITEKIISGPSKDNLDLFFKENGQVKSVSTKELLNKFMP